MSRFFGFALILVGWFACGSSFMLLAKRVIFEVAGILSSGGILPPTQRHCEGGICSLFVLSWFCVCSALRNDFLRFGVSGTSGLECCFYGCLCCCFIFAFLLFERKAFVFSVLLVLLDKIV